jgi:chromate reductase, NAD(P)H dehydrogenase (quinone)
METGRDIVAEERDAGFQRPVGQGNHALRHTLVFLNMLVMQQTEAYIGGAGDLFDKAGKLTSHETGEFLTKFMTAFADWAAKLRRV